MWIAEHFPALQTLLPFCAGLICALCRLKLARIIMRTVTAVNTIISIYGDSVLNDIVYYHFGNWPANIGIEYRLDQFNQPIIIYVNFILLLSCTIFDNLMYKLSIKPIALNKQNLFYSVLLFASSGYIGIISTNDIFNLYVFIEISSICTYILIAQGVNKNAAVAAFDYLILGSIGATFILIATAIILSVTGSLNISYIYQYLQNANNKNIIYTATAFIIIGCMLKVAFFPMHFWMLRAYRATSASILIYIGSISSIIGIYICFRFLQYLIGYQYAQRLIDTLITPLSLIAVFVCSILAKYANNVRTIIIYAAAAQTACAMLLISLNSPYATSLLYKLLFVDGLNKCALFALLSFTETSNNKYKPHNNHIAIILLLICASALPPSPMFIIKFNMLRLFLEHNRWYEFITIIIASAISVLYYYKIANIIHGKNLYLPSIGFYILIVSQFAVMLFL